ncbi:MAG: hypothetical protein JNM96_01600 [Bacteroidia bacterium]|nr:hypothetical protein [Bacteroidia bacterium]
MNKEVEKILIENMSIDNAINNQETPPLSALAIETIKARKLAPKNKHSVFYTIIERIFNAYKMPLIGCLVVITLVLINATEFTTAPSGEYASTYTTEDTVLTVHSNTNLASLRQSSVLQLPAKTNTALTCITTIVCKN